MELTDEPELFAFRFLDARIYQLHGFPSSCLMAMPHRNGMHPLSIGKNVEVSFHASHLLIVACLINRSSPTCRPVCI